MVVLSNHCLLGLLDAFPLPFLGETALHLLDHTEHREHDMAHFAPGGNVRVKHGDVGAFLLAYIRLRTSRVSRLHPRPKNSEMVVSSIRPSWLPATFSDLMTSQRRPL